MNEIKITCTFDDNTKRMHRFPIDPGPEGITGVVYVPQGSPIPDFLNIRLRTRAEAQAEKKGMDELNRGEGLQK